METRDICVKEVYSLQGEEKIKWHKIGALFLHEDGRIGMKFVALPIDGNCYAFKRKPKT